MSRIPDRYLEHRVDVTPSTDYGFDEPRPNVRALVRHGTSKVIDGRTSSETYGQEITATSRITMQPDATIKPGALFTVWKGTPQEAKLEAVQVHYNRHSVAPESTRVWCV